MVPKVKEGEENMTDIFDFTMEVEEDTQKDRYLIFSLDKECYGIEIKNVTEIIGIQTITEIPQLPDYVKGIINLRGKIIPVVDVRVRFKKELKEYNDRTCVIVFAIRDQFVGLIVDSVAEVLTIPEQDTVDPPQINKVYHNNYIKKIGKVDNSVKLILDCEKLLTEEELKNLTEAI